MGNLNITGSSHILTISTTGTNSFDLNPVVVTVTFNANSGVTPTFTTKEVALGSVYGEFPTTHRTGYIFDGWFTLSSGGTEVWESTTVSNSSNHTLYARWYPIVYSVSFQGNGATSGSMSNQNFTYNVSQALTANAFSKTNYSFNGWNTNSSGTGTSYTNQQVVSNLTIYNGFNVNLYAQWTPVNAASQWYYYGLSDPGDLGEGYLNYYPVFNTTSCPVLATITNNLDFNRPPSNYAKGVIASVLVKHYCTGGTPACWCEIDGGGGSTCTKYCDTYYYIAAGADVTATFNPNGGTWWDTTTANKTSSITPGYETVNAPGSITKTGHTFVGWSPTLPTTISTSTTFTAQWTANSFEITLDPNGGTAASNNKISVTYGSSIEAFNINMLPSRTNHTFLGYYTTSVVVGATQRISPTAYTNLTSTTYTSAVTLYALWEVDNAATQWYYYGTSNPGTLPGGSGTLNYDYEEYYCPSTNTLSSWLNINYPPSDYSTEYKMTIYVRSRCYQGDPECICNFLDCWKTCGTYYFIALGNNVTASFAGLSGADPNSYSSQSVAPGYQNVTSPGSPTKLGYAFTGWSPSLPRAITTNTTFTAQFSTGSYTITLDANGGTTATDPIINFTYGTYLEAFTTDMLPSRYGYTFNGYYTATSGGTQRIVSFGYVALTSTTYTSNATLYAQWSPKQPTVTFNANGGSTPSPTSKVVTYGLQYGTLATTSRSDGYTFNGWFTASSGGSKILSTTVVTNESNHILYAQWTPVGAYSRTLSWYTGTVSNISNTYDNNTSTYATQTSYNSIITYTYSGTIPSNLNLNLSLISGYFDILGESSDGGTSLFQEHPTNLARFVVSNSPNGSTWNTRYSSLVSSGVHSIPISSFVSPYIRIEITLQPVLNDPDYEIKESTFVSGQIRINEVFYE